MVHPLHQHSNVEQISHKWVKQVLRYRGIPSPELVELERILSTTPHELRSDIYQSLLRIERGTERSDDIDRVLAALEDLGSDARSEGECSLALGHVGAATSTQPERIEQRMVAQPKKRQTRIAANIPKHRVFGQKGALTFEVSSLSQIGTHGAALQTLTLEAASAAGPRAYAWSDKIVFQFMYRELPLLACMLLGLLERPLQLENHGPEGDKSLSIADQGDKLYVLLRQGARVTSVPVGPSDVHALIELSLHVMAANAPALGAEIQNAALRRVASMYNQRAGTGVKTLANAGSE